MNSAVETIDPIAAIAPRPAPRTSQRDDAHASSFADHMRRETSRSDLTAERRDAQRASDADNASARREAQRVSDADSASASAHTDAANNTDETVDKAPISAQAADETPTPPLEKSEHAATQKNCAYLIQSLVEEDATAPAQEAAPKAENPKSDPAPQNVELIIAQADSAQADALKEAMQADAVCDAPAPLPASKTPLATQDDQDEPDTQADAAASPPILMALPQSPAQPQPVAPKSEVKSADAIDAAAPRAPASAGPPQQPKDANAAPVDQSSAPAPKAAADAPRDDARPQRAEARADAPTAPAQPQTPPQNVSASAQTNANPIFNPALAPPSAIAPLQTANAAQALSAETARTLPAHAQVGREIVRRFDGQNAKFEIRLDPPELGRIEIKLEVSRDHKVNAIVSAENPQALADLTRSARDLTNALQSAGLELNNNGLSFNLSQREQHSSSDQQSGGRNAQPNATTELETTPAPQQRLTLEAWRGGRIDLVA